MAVAHPPFVSDRRVSSLGRHSYYPALDARQDSPMSGSHNSWHKSSSSYISPDYHWAAWQPVETSYSTLYSAFRPTDAIDDTHPTSETNSPQLSLPDYPESSQRTILSESQSPSSLGSLTFTPTSNDARINSPFKFSPAESNGLLYTMEEEFDPPKVKEEQHESSFVFEASLPTTPMVAMGHSSESQVPLRATQASKEMRRMMGVFRLDPFAVQGHSVQQAEAGPLEEEGKLIEFQIKMDSDEPTPPPSPMSSLRALSPSSLKDSWVPRTTSSSPDSGRGPADLDAPAWGYPLDLTYPLLAPANFRGDARGDADAELARGAGGSRAETLDQRFGGASAHRGFTLPMPHGDHDARRRRVDYDAFSAEPSLRRYSGRSAESSRLTTSGTSYSEDFEQHRYGQSATMSMNLSASLPRMSGGSRRWGGHGNGGYV